MIAQAIATMMSDYGSAIRTDAEGYDVPVFNVDGAFEQRVAAALAYLLTPPTGQRA